MIESKMSLQFGLVFCMCVQKSLLALITLALFCHTFHSGPDSNYIIHYGTVIDYSRFLRYNSMYIVGFWIHNVKMNLLLRN